MVFLVKKPLIPVFFFSSSEVNSYPVPTALSDAFDTAVFHFRSTVQTFHVRCSFHILFFRFFIEKRMHPFDGEAVLYVYHIK